MLEATPERVARWRRGDHDSLELEGRSPAETARYLSWEGCGGRLIPALNEPRAAMVLADKVSFERIVRDAGIPVPETVAVLDGPDPDLTELVELLASRAPAGVVVKPSASHQGKGVVVFESIEPGGTHGTTVRGRRRSVRSAVDHAAGTPGGEQVVVQRTVRQHPEIDAYGPYPHSTVRVVTLLRRDGSVRVLGAFIRLAGHGAMTDNTTRGGVGVDGDPETGVLGGGVLEKPLRRLHRHPDAREPFRGRRLPFWVDVLAVCCRAAPLFPDVRLVGWDVMITRDGPLLMEANRDIRLRTLQAVRGRGVLDDTMLADLTELGVAVDELSPLPLPPDASLD